MQIVNFEKLNMKNKKIALRNLKKKIQEKVGVKIGMERAFLKKLAGQCKFPENGEKVYNTKLF